MKLTIAVAAGIAAIFLSSAAQADGTVGTMPGPCAGGGKVSVTISETAAGQGGSASENATASTCGGNGSSSLNGGTNFTYTNGDSAGSSSGHGRRGGTNAPHRPH